MRNDIKEQVLALMDLDVENNPDEYEKLQLLYDEFTPEERALRPKKLDECFSGDNNDYIEALTHAIIKLSYEIKVSRYTIVDAIRRNIECNY